MKKKLIYFTSLLTVLILLALSIFLNFTYSPFNADNVKNNIALFSSETYEGRLPGTKGNLLVGEIIRNNFQTNNLVPLNEDYKESFKALCPVKENSSASIKILSEDKIIEELKYGTDYKEDMLNFRSNTITFSKDDKINIYTNSFEVITDNGNCLFYVPKNNDFSFRSSFMSDFPYDMLIAITTDTYNKILNSVRSGLTISVNIPFTISEKELFNVVGVIEGSSDNLPPLVLTAHYDHLGKDGLNNTYKGALDNASGTSFLLELQRTLSSFKKPKRDIIFVALNAEEFGLLGSKSFAERNYDIIKDAEIINFDMIGSEDYPLTLMLGIAAKNKESKLLDSIIEIAEDNKVKTEVVYEDSSDHASFNNEEIDALSFCHSDTSRIHTPNDTVEYISTEAIESAYSVIQDKIYDSCYSNLTIFFYTETSIITFSTLLFLLIVVPIILKKIDKKAN
ncbi:M28 family metallopeptidase [Clostridium isatidis]|uniref:Peptidase, M28 family protein n=1 Tax=Clostridium isatidis TaxID=182773 RepID=A0A343JES9_9CLOT|nr:M28 family metallopeptidase [Clostridium isatidis]ASW44037.1 peptidase, M28 family protein [Clostridium isatidis]